jgi:DNA-binding transcriptional regulator YdaS (Cro superfamily)
MNKTEALKFFGNSSRLALALGVSKQAVSRWPESIPIGRQFQIEVLSGGELKAERSQVSEDLEQKQCPPKPKRPLTVFDRLHSYIKDKYESDAEREAFCELCGTTWGYIKKIRCTHQPLRESVCINFERETAGFVRCEDLRPDVDWAYIRGTETVVA